MDRSPMTPPGTGTPCPAAREIHGTERGLGAPRGTRPVRWPLRRSPGPSCTATARISCCRRLSRWPARAGTAPPTRPTSGERSRSTGPWRQPVLSTFRVDRAFLLVGRLAALARAEARFGNHRLVNPELAHAALARGRVEGAGGRHETRRPAEAHAVVLDSGDQQPRIGFGVHDADRRHDAPSVSWTSTRRPNFVGRCGLPRRRTWAGGSNRLTPRRPAGRRPVAVPVPARVRDPEDTEQHHLTEQSLPIAPAPGVASYQNRGPASNGD